MSSTFLRQLRRVVRSWWREHSTEKGFAKTAFLLLRNVWDFMRESTPERHRSRYGDAEYDWQYRVNTTSGTVGWRARLLGMFLSAYQPTDPVLFHEMMASLPIQFDRFTFVDLGSGKGRTLLMASEYPFRKIVGIEILADLHESANENLAQFKTESQKCFAIEALCGDAAEYSFPTQPVVVYLFNPLPESGLRRVLANLEENLQANPRTVYILYHNPELDHLLSSSTLFKKIAATDHFSIYAFMPTKAGLLLPQERSPKDNPH